MPQNPRRSWKGRLSEIILNLMVGGMSHEQAQEHAKTILEQERAASLEAVPVKA